MSTWSIGRAPRGVVVGLVVAFLLSRLGMPSQLSAADAPFPRAITSYLHKHCVECHGPRKQESRLRLDQLAGFRAGDRNLWTIVHEKVSTGDMPPQGRPRPPQAETQSFLKWIEEQQRGQVLPSTRRLNRRELAAALRDLTGLPIDFAYGLPGDGTVAGFDTGAEGLQDTADGVSQWMTVSRRAVEGLRILDPSTGPVFTANLRDSKDPKKVLDEWKNAGASGKGQGIARPGVGLLIEPRAVGDRDSFHIRVPAPAAGQGVLRLRVRVSALKGFERIPHPRLWVEIGGKDIDYREITGTFDEPQELVYFVQLGDLAIQSNTVSIQLSNKVEIPYAVEGFENEDKSNPKEPVPGGTGLFRPQFDRKALPPEKQPAPYIVLQQLEVEPNYVSPWPPAKWRAELGEPFDPLQVSPPDHPRLAERLLGLWMERAWRRPVTPAERAPFLKLYERLRREGLSFDDSLRAAFQSVLQGAPFRYLASTADPDATIAQHAIASRLSFMLVGEPPDAELRRLAAAGKLREPAVINAQVDRLLADPRSRAFVQPFVTQWLEMEQPITIAMSHIQKQDFRFARYLKASMREETISYVGQMFARNRPVRELIRSDWTMMNDILAIHYGYPQLEGGTLREVQLQATDPRGGGILSHAGLQSMLCWMGDNWVIYRGAWALRHILDDPPPPPPLEVPELNPSAAQNQGKTFRELLKQHQEDSRCNVCHKNIDPLGFAFQNFDLSGRWRTVEFDKYERSELDGKIAWRGAGKTRPVDAAGQLPRGEEFRNFAEFQQLLVKHYQADLVRGLLKKFVLYATGRTPDVDDMIEIRIIMKEHEQAGYPLRDLLKAVIRSRVFLERG